MISEIMYIAHTLGLTTSQVIGMCGLTSIVVGLKTYKGINEIIEENTQNQHEKMKTKKKSIELKEFDEDLEKQKAEVETQLEKIKLEKKQREINEYNLIGTHADPVLYKGLKPKNRHDLLLGYNAEYQPVWGSDTNYIIAGCTGSGKTRLMYAILLNYLANKQGVAYVCDLKGVDFKYFKGCRGVSIYIDDLNDVMQALTAFLAEYEQRKALFSAENYIDINDYNSRNPNAQLKDFLLIIDEFADISDVFSKNHKPIGLYSQLIEMARKCRAYGGRIILGTQRPLT